MSACCPDRLPMYPVEGGSLELRHLEDDFRLVIRDQKQKLLSFPYRIISFFAHSEIKVRGKCGSSKEKEHAGENSLLLSFMAFV